jgi:hypothetical protein
MSPISARPAAGNTAQLHMRPFEWSWCYCPELVKWRSFPRAGKELQICGCTWWYTVHNFKHALTQIIDFSEAFDLVPRDRLLTNIAAIGVDLRVVVRVKEFLLGRSQRVTVDGQLSEEVRVRSGVPQGSVLGPLLFLACVNDIWRNTESKIRLFEDNCLIYRKITDWM